MFMINFHLSENCYVFIRHVKTCKVKNKSNIFARNGCQCFLIIMVAEMNTLDMFKALGMKLNSHCSQLKCNSISDKQTLHVQGADI